MQIFPAVNSPKSTKNLFCTGLPLDFSRRSANYELVLFNETSSESSEHWLWRRTKVTKNLKRPRVVHLSSRVFFPPLYGAIAQEQNYQAQVARPASNTVEATSDQCGISFLGVLLLVCLLNLFLQLEISYPELRKTQPNYFEIGTRFEISPKLVSCKLPR